MNRIYFIIGFIIANTFLSYSQVISQKIGNNPTIINPSAALEIESSSKGVLLPRVSLTSTTSASPLTAHVSGMMVYNTATTSDVTPGVYTNNGTGWIRNGLSSSSGGIYSGNGSLQTGTTTVTQGGNKLAFVTDNTVSDAFSVDGSTLSVDALNDAVGIGTKTPLASARLEVNSTTKGFLPPRMTMLQRNGIASPATGLIIWCTNCGTSGQMQVYNGSSWTDILGVPAASVLEVASINCSGAIHNGALLSGAAASGVSSVIAYTGGNGGTYAAQSIASTGVTGLTATLTAGTLASGAGTLTYTITGTPSVIGTASFAISLGGQTCTLTRIVEGVITSLDCSNATHNGTLIIGTAASGVSSVIAYTGGNGGTYAAQSIASTGVTGLTATLTAGTLASGVGTLTYTITGTPSASGIASFAINIGGQTCSLVRTIIPLAASLSALNCSGATHNGILTTGTAASGVSSVIAYTGGNGGSYAAQSIVSTGVSGLTATLAAGTLANGAGTMAFTITGTPSTTGTASFAINIGGQTCSLSRSVSQLADSLTFLDCSGATHNGTLTSGTTASGVSSVITYSGGNGGAYAAQSIASTGVTGLTASAAAGTLANGAGTMTYTITGTPSTSGTATFTINLGGQTCTFSRSVIPLAASITTSFIGFTNNGTLTSGTAASGVSSLLSYTGGNGGTYAAQSIASTGVTGLTATLAAGTLASGAGTLTYTITGTPSTNGTADFEISIGGQSFRLSRIINLSSLDCAGATHNGTLIASTAASGVSSVIAYTGGGGVTYAAQSIASTGVTGLTAVLPAGVLVNGNGTVTYTITGTPATNGTASFAINIGGRTCTLTRTVLALASLTTLNCSGATHNGTLTMGTAASGVSSVISYTGGNGGTYTAQSIASTGVTGLTATLADGTLASGSGTLTYTITGTPATSGTASFAINLGGQLCTFTRTVVLPLASLAALDCSGATHNGLLAAATVASGASSVIAYTGGNGGTYAAQSIASTGVTGLTATLTAGTLASGAGTLTYTITGTPATSGTASFAISLGGQTCILTRNVQTLAATLTALNCSGATHNGTLTAGTAASGVSFNISYTGGNGGSYAAQSIASTGITGLTATLAAGTLASGAGTVTYSITGTPSANGLASFAISLGGQSCTLIRQVGCGAYTASGVYTVFACHNLGADTALDPHTLVQGIHGNYYQWGRATVVASASTSSAAISGWNTSNAASSSWLDASKTANDPCPSGFRVPTSTQWAGVVANNTLSRTGTWSSSETNFGSAIHYGPNSTTKWLTLPAAGYRGDTNGALLYRGGSAYYWSSTQDSSIGNYSNYFNGDINNSNTRVVSYFRILGLSVRCVSQ